VEALPQTHLLFGFAAAVCPLLEAGSRVPSNVRPTWATMEA
jgi:hypothetical protein